MNIRGLLKRVNDPTAFDLDLQPKAKDRLEIHFTCKDSYLSYGYEYRKSKWVEISHDPFEWKERHEGTHIWCPQAIPEE